MIETNKIYNMDCLKGLKQLEDNSVDLIVTDPPYNLNKDFENDNLSEEEFIRFLSPIFDEMARVIKPKHSVIIFFDNGQKLPLFWRCLFNSKLIFQKGGNFYKPNDCSMPHNRILRKSEVFYVCSKTAELHHDGEKYIHDCLIGNHTHKESWYHPTAKNLKIIRELILSHSIKGELVLDPFSGSGTSALACYQTERKYIGFEISEEYCNIANKRLNQKILKEVWAGCDANDDGIPPTVKTVGILPTIL
jgi:site-specific DNA-methyltransferase (adenine-specific)